MKYRPFSKNLLRTCIFTALLTDLAFGQNADVINRFESEYEAWKAYVEENKFISTAAANKHLHNIVKIGVPVLPLIVEKMDKNESGFDFQLGFAFYLITRKIFEKEDWPEGKLGDARTKAAMYVNWWHSGLKNTRNSFDRYYQEWKSSLGEGNEEEAERKLLSIKKLGIAAIPFMIDKIKEGDLEFVKIISDFTNGSLSDNASKDECISWWNENKEKYTIIKD